MKAHRAEFSIAAMCRVLRVSRSGYYAWLKRPPSRWDAADRELLELIRRIHAESRGTYGAPRVQAKLRELGVRASRRRIGRLMARDGLRGVCRRRRWTTTRSDGSEVAADLVNREFHAERPDELWVADATYVPTAEGTLYLAVVQDVFSRRIVGWSMARRQKAELMIQALEMAVARRRPRNQVTHHSDHGSQYTSDPFREVCEESDVTLSMGSVGDCYDNAMAESFFATLETELIDRQPRGRFASREQARSMIFDYVEGFYNTRRLHSSLGYLSPMEFERRHATAK